MRIRAAKLSSEVAEAFACSAVGCKTVRTFAYSHFCVFKYERAVKRKVWNTPYGRVRLARFALKTLTPRLTDFFTDFEKKNRPFYSLVLRFSGARPYCRTIKKFTKNE